jgi:hypothetical protein
VLMDCKAEVFICIKVEVWEQQGGSIGRQPVNFYLDSQIRCRVQQKIVATWTAIVQMF